MGTVATLAVVTGCTSTTALQTASTVDPGAWRIGGQLSASPYCSLTGSPLARCAALPQGFPLPELRASGRYGFSPRWDAGLSVHGAGVIPRGFQLGLLADLKRELWQHTSAEGRRHVVAASIGADVTGVFTRAFTDESASTAQLSIPVAGWYGYQLQRWELFASPAFVERLTPVDVDGDGRAELIDVGYLGLTFGALSRGTTRYGASLEYQAPTGDLVEGRFTVALGVLWDLP